jgi:uroporphyrinogen decarboxylase
MSGDGLKNDLLLRAAKRQRTERTPVWLMRQAGRFDPAYRELRANSGLELEELFHDPELATEITLLPKRLGVDALILFQDILTPLEPMGARFVFRPGPVLDTPIRTSADVEALREFDPAADLGFIGESIRLVLEANGGDIPLLGFAGSPFTLAAFMIEGRSPGEMVKTRTLMREQPQVLHELLSRLADMTARYLDYKIRSGVHGVQLFESLGDSLTADEYKTFAHPYHAKVFAQMTEQAPRILFVKERPELDLMAESGADVLSIGQCVDLQQARRDYGDRLALQGNVDNQILRGGTPDEVEAATRACIEAGGHLGHILNLNHGIFKDTPYDNVVRLIDVCRETAVTDSQGRPAETTS